MFPILTPDAGPAYLMDSCLFCQILVGMSRGMKSTANSDHLAMPGALYNQHYTNVVQPDYKQKDEWGQEKWPGQSISQDGALFYKKYLIILTTIAEHGGSYTVYNMAPFCHHHLPIVSMLELDFGVCNSLLPSTVSSTHKIEYVGPISGVGGDSLLPTTAIILAQFHR